MCLSDKILAYGVKKLQQQGFTGVQALGTKLGQLLWLVLAKRRKLALDNMVKHLQISPAQAEILVKENFKQTGQAFLESALIPKFSINSPLLQINQPQFVERIFNEPRPCVLITAHLGAWELLASIGSEVNKTRPCIVVVRSYKNSSLARLTSELRSSHQVEVIGHREAAAPVLANLRQNGMVVFLADHNTSQSEAVFLPFLQDLAAVNKGPALLGVRAKAMVWPVFLYREQGKYCLDIDPPLDTKELTGDVSTKVTKVAEFYTKAIAKAVQAHPEQWFWIHNRWKTRPA